MKLKTTLILFAVVIVLFALVYAFELRKSDDNKASSSKKLEVLYDIPFDSVNKVEIAYTIPKATNLTLTKDSRGIWQSNPPSKDSNTISKSISTALGRSIFRDIKEAGRLEDYGLVKPRIMATFHLQDSTTKKIMIGNEVPTGNYVYIKEGSLPDIYIIPASIVDDFTKLISN